MKPRGGPAGNPSVILVQLDDATRQLQDLQEEAAQLAKVGSACALLFCVWTLRAVEACSSASL